MQGNMAILQWCLSHPHVNVSFEYDGETLFFGLDANKIGFGASNSMTELEAKGMTEPRMVNEINLLWNMVRDEANRFAKANPEVVAKVNEIQEKGNEDADNEDR